MLSEKVEATENFLNHIEFLAKNAGDRKVAGFAESSTQLMTRFIQDTKELIFYNEWVIGLENLLNNLYEIGFPLDSQALDLARIAIEKAGMKYEEWKFIEELARVKDKEYGG